MLGLYSRIYCSDLVHDPSKIRCLSDSCVLRNVISCSMRPQKAVIMVYICVVGKEEKAGGPTAAMMWTHFMSFWKHVGVIPCAKIPASLWFAFDLKNVTRPALFWLQFSIKVNSWKPQFTAVYVMRRYHCTKQRTHDMFLITSLTLNKPQCNVVIPGKARGRAEVTPGL